MSGASLAFLLEFGLMFGAIFAFGFWQLYSLSKLKKEREAKEREAASEEATRHPEG